MLVYKCGTFFTKVLIKKHLWKTKYNLIRHIGRVVFIFHVYFISLLIVHLLFVYKF